MLKARINFAGLSEGLQAATDFQKAAKFNIFNAFLSGKAGKLHNKSFCQSLVWDPGGDLSLGRQLVGWSDGWLVGWSVDEV